MTKTWYNLWPKQIVIKWIQIHDDTKFVTDWWHIYDEKTNFVNDEQMWRHLSDQTKIVTKTSQKTNCDHSGVFNDDNATSLMTTSLLLLETLSLTKFLRYVFHEQGIHDFRESGTSDASDSRTCEFRASWIGEDSGSWTRGSLEPRTSKGTNFGWQLIRESVGSPVRKSCAEKFTNRWRIKVKVVVPKSPGFECELVAGL
jgi:hypothetical protein